MRLKISLAALAAIGVATAVGFRVADDHANGATESAPAPAMMAMPVPVVSVVKKTLPIYLEYPGRIESIRSIALQARVSGYIDAQPAADGADVKSGDLLYQIDPARPSGGARSGERPGAARPGVARLCEGQLRSRRGTGQKRLRNQGRLRSEGELDASGRGAAGARPRGDRGGEAQSRIYGNPRAFRWQAWAQPGGQGRAGQPDDRGAEYPGSA